jgi:hypothetical protein
MRECPPRPWQVLSFAPFYFTVAFLGRFVVFLTAGNAVGFDQLAGWVYPAWVALGVVCPILALAGWLLTRCGGHGMYPGLWLRLSADMGMAAGLAAFLVAFAAKGLDNDHASLLAAGLLGSILAWLAVSVVLDVWRIVDQNRIAAFIRSISE